MKKPLTLLNENQYQNSGTVPVSKSTIKTGEQQQIESLDTKLQRLEALTESQHGTIMKLQRDINRLKDQISDLASNVKRS